jgi:pimeloyl-ACP methyl ester carboxylesterase
MPEPPAEMGALDGLAYAMFLPAQPPTGSVLILHGAGSAKESHFDFARAARAAGFAALAFDQRGHGDSGGELGAGLLDDIRAMAGLLPEGALALRGSSMGGYLALVAAGPLRARAVVAICPASAQHLLRALRAGELRFGADRAGLEAFLDGHDLAPAVAQLDAALLIMHAEGDEQIPAAHSSELHAMAATPRKRLLIVPGGHHRSVQHDPELNAEALRFIQRALATEPAPRAG